MQLKILTAIAAIGLLLSPAAALAYNQGYYEGYYQGYYQPYYQGYYQTYYQGYYQAAYGLTFSGNVSILGNAQVTGNISKGSGTFVIDDPIDPLNKLLFHSFVESPDAKNLYDGIATLDDNGEATVALPDYFEALNKDFRYQLKPIGAPMPTLYVKQEVANNSFVIGGGAARGRVSWQVTGTRHDAYITANPIIPEVDKGPDAIAVKGEFLYKDGYKIEWPIHNELSAAWDFISGLFGKK